MQSATSGPSGGDDSMRQLPPSPRMQPTGRGCPVLRPGGDVRWDVAERRFVRARA